MNVVALAGGVGGAKLADGLAQILPPEQLTIVVNTGDDLDHFGLSISPDLDTVCYTLAGLANPETGWGLAGETWNTIEAAVKLGGPSWFRLGDRDLGTHLERTRRLRLGQPLSEITRAFCQAWGIGPSVLPMSDQPVHTLVLSDAGTLPFQDYFVRLRCEPRVTGFIFDGVQQAKPAPGVIESLERADLVVICPSNPWVSVDPILAIPGMRAGLGRRRVVAVSPIIAGQTVKGPAAKMYAELGIEPSALAVARHYGAETKGGLLAGFVFDKLDASQTAQVQSIGLRAIALQTLMKTPADRQRLAQEVINFASTD